MFSGRMTSKTITFGENFYSYVSPVQQGNEVLSTIDNEEEKETKVKEDVKDFACEFCPKKFLTRKCLTAHKATHVLHTSKELEKVWEE